MARRSDRTRRGTSLIEAVIASALLAVVLTGVAPLVVAAVAGTDAIRVSLLAEHLARQRLAQVQALTHMRVAGVVVADGSTGFAGGDFVVGGAGLAATGLAPLQASVAGWSDWLDARGDWVSSSVGPPPEARYRRRWGILPDPSGIGCVRVWVDVTPVPAGVGQHPAHAAALQCPWGAWP